VVKSRRVRSHNLNDGDVITIGRHDLIYIDERSGKPGQTDSHKALPQLQAETADAPDAPGHHGETQVL
jgi:pSer/pThr/pTyr-binding forkhead associated (FHA) protein